MDLSQIQMAETVRVHIEHPRHGPLYADEGRTEPCVIEVFSPASDQAIAQKRKALKRFSERVGKKGLKGVGMAPEEMEAAEVDRLIALTCSVENLELNGEPITPENIGRVYNDPRYGWIKEQVSEQIGDWEAFLT